MEPARLSAPAARLPWLLAGGALAVAGWLGWQVYGPAVHGDPLATSLVALEKQNRLTVFSAQLSPVVAADDLPGDVVDNVRRAILPQVHRDEVVGNIIQIPIVRIRRQPAQIRLPALRPGRQREQQGRCNKNQ